MAVATKALKKKTPSKKTKAKTAAKPKKPITMASGTQVSSAWTPKRRAIRPVRES